MAGHTFFGKRKLCYTDVVDYTDFQGIGRDPLYMRYDSVYSVIKTAVPPEYRHFLAVPQYIDDEDQICWHIDEWKDYPIKLTELSESERTRYEAIKNDTIRQYRNAAANLDGESLQILASAIRYIDDNRIYCADGKVYLVAWGMTPDTTKHNVSGSIIHEYDEQKKYKITFDVGEHGTLNLKIDKQLTRVDGAILTEDDIPEVIANEGWSFAGWTPNPIRHIVKDNAIFSANYNKVEKSEEEPPVIIPPIEPEEPEFFNCAFDAGEHGKLDGVGYFSKPAGSKIETSEIPRIRADKNYEFTGWSPSPYNCIVNEDKRFVAQYKENIPWYRRWWLWLTGLFAGKGCLKWLLWLLLAILLCWLLSWLLRGCVGCTGHHTPVNGIVPVDTITRSDGRVIDDNGHVRPITGNDGTLPDDNTIVAPIMGEDGTYPHIVEQPGAPSIMGDRLFLFMEDENGDIESLARDYKKAYPGDEYGIIGYDKEVKLLVIQVPENERDQIRRTINNQLPNHKFIVFDEEVYELNGHVSSYIEDAGWHLSAIHLKQGWAITKGLSDIRVAIVDDGIQADHPMFNGRIVDAYNVFTQNNTLSIGQGHGTHTAGLAVGSADYYNKGASGVAPNCKLMPIQVFDNGKCPLSAMVAGVMYALHHDADVVNISIAPSFKGLNVLPVTQQDQIAKTQFHNVAALWARVSKLAAKKKSILVFAAGNDDILTSIPPENRNESSIVVTAVDKRLYPTVFTNYGPCSDISAPGNGIYSSYPSSTFQSCDGTSMSAPIVSGTIALMKSLKKDLTVEQARNVLYSTGADVYGWIPPMVLVDKALEATQNGDFQRKERQMRPVPDIENFDSNSGGIPDTKEIVVDEPPRPANPNSDETDYDAIRRQIAEYQQKIRELEKLLPKK